MNISVKTAEISAIRVSQNITKTVSRHAEVQIFRPFSFGSSRFNVQTGAQNGATTQFESDRLLYQY
eukprot:COSAG06_NODE_826_length_12064_cov_8.219975_8_plen_66_part_00